MQSSRLLVRAFRRKPPMGRPPAQQGQRKGGCNTRHWNCQCGSVQGLPRSQCRRWTSYDKAAHRTHHHQKCLRSATEGKRPVCLQNHREAQVPWDPKNQHRRVAVCRSHRSSAEYASSVRGHSLHIVWGTQGMHDSLRVRRKGRHRTGARKECRRDRRASWSPPSGHPRRSEIHQLWPPSHTHGSLCACRTMCPTTKLKCTTRDATRHMHAKRNPHPHRRVSNDGNIKPGAQARPDISDADPRGGSRGLRSRATADAEV